MIVEEWNSKNKIDNSSLYVSVKQIYNKKECSTNSMVTQFWLNVDQNVFNIHLPMINMRTWLKIMFKIAQMPITVWDTFHTSKNA